MKLSEYKTEDLINEVVERDCLDDLLSEADEEDLLFALDLKDGFNRAVQLANTGELIKELENRPDLNNYGEYVSDIFVESKLANLGMSTSWDRNSAKEYINIILKLNGLNDLNDVIESIKELYKY